MSNWMYYKSRRFRFKIGYREKGNESFMGHYGKGTRNSNGEHLIQFLLQHQLYAANTHFT